MIVRLLVLFTVGAAVNASFLRPAIAPSGFRTAQTQFINRRAPKSEIPEEQTAPAGFGAGQSQAAFPPHTPDTPPVSSAPAGFGAAQSQAAFPIGRPESPSPETAPAGFGAGASQQAFPPLADPGFPSPPLPPADVIPILVDERDGPHSDGSYSFNFETGNGINRYEEGTPQGEEGAVAMQGGWSFIFPDGTPAVFRFVADSEGYRVESDLLPKSPPLPPHAIAQINAAREQRARAAAASGDKQYDF